MVKEVIGFSANGYYTLWKREVRGDGEEINLYIKSLGKSLEKVKEKYPKVKIDLELRGKYSGDIDKIQFGSYKGRSIRQIVAHSREINDISKCDISYLYWLATNKKTSSRLRDYLARFPEIFKYPVKKEALDKEIKERHEKCLADRWKEGELNQDGIYGHHKDEGSIIELYNAKITKKFEVRNGYGDTTWVIYIKCRGLLYYYEGNSKFILSLGLNEYFSLKGTSHLDYIKGKPVTRISNPRRAKTIIYEVI